MKTHSACGAQREVVHLLGERSHNIGGVKRQTGLDGCGWSDHSALRQEEPLLVPVVGQRKTTRGAKFKIMIDELN